MVAMKIIRAFPLAIVTACLLFAGCDNELVRADAAATGKVVDEKTAIMNLKAEIERVGTWLEEKYKTFAQNPEAKWTMMDEVFAKQKSIKTDGLPADFKAAWDARNGALTESGDFFKVMHKAKQENRLAAMSASGEVTAKLTALRAKHEPIERRLKEVAAKYGVDLTKIGLGK